MNAESNNGAVFWLTYSIAHTVSMPRRIIIAIWKELLSFWDYLDDIEINLVLGIASIAFGYILTAVEYELQLSGVRLPLVSSLEIYIPWQSLPIWLIIAGMVLLRPVQRLWIHFVATMPMLFYGILLILAVGSGNETLRGILPASYVLAFWCMAIISLRKYFAENARIMQLARLTARAERLEIFVTDVMQYVPEEVQAQVLVNFRATQESVIRNGHRPRDDRGVAAPVVAGDNP